MFIWFTEMAAERYNKGKVQLSLVDPLFIEEVAKVMELGARKYGKDNWLKGQPYMQVLDSMKRHIAEFEHGESRDKESGLHPLAHVACNVMFLLRYDLDAAYEENELDDRIYKSSTVFKQANK